MHIPFIYTCLKHQFMQSYSPDLDLPWVQGCQLIYSMRNFQNGYFSLRPVPLIAGSISGLLVVTSKSNVAEKVIFLCSGRMASVDFPVTDSCTHSLMDKCKIRLQLMHLTIVLFTSIGIKYGNLFTRNLIMLKNSR